MTPVRLEAAAPRSRVKHSTSELLRSHPVYTSDSLMRILAFSEDLDEMPHDVRVKIDPWNQFYSYCFNRLNISSEYNDFCFIHFQKFKCLFPPPIKMYLKTSLNLMLSRSMSTYDHHLNNLGRPYILNATDQCPRLSAFWLLRRRFAKGVSIYGQSGHFGHATGNS